MSDRSSARDRDAVAPAEPPPDGEAWAPELFDDPPVTPRGRSRLVTPVTLALSTVVVAAAGFIAGVQVQKRHGGSGGGALASAPAASNAQRAAIGADTAQGETTLGSVADKRGSSLYVKSADGTTVRVKTNAQSKVTRTAAASARGIYPGDTVVVRGAKDKDGNVVATQVAATAKSVASSGGGFGRGFRQFGGGGGGGGAGPPGAATGSAPTG